MRHLRHRPPATRNVRPSPRLPAHTPIRYPLPLPLPPAAHREWALLIPAYGMVLVLLTYFTYFALALAGTPAFSDSRTITGACLLSQKIDRRLTTTRCAHRL